MTHRRRRRALVALSAGILAVPLVAALDSASATPLHRGPDGPTVVVSGLNNPRQLALIDGGDVLLVAEAGKGGSLATITDPEGGEQGLGFTGSISAVLAPRAATGQKPHRIVTGLLSAAATTSGPQGPAGGGATGPDGVAATSLRKLAIAETTFGPATPARGIANDGHLLTARPFGAAKQLADITGYEKAHDPDGQGIDSNPYAVLPFQGGWLVADAAANDVLQVDQTGHVSVFHVFPNVTSGLCADPSVQDPPGVAGCNFVPTSLATDQYSHVWVGGLGSLTPGAGRVVVLTPNGKGIVKTFLGFNSIDGIAVDQNGTLYVSQLMAAEAHPAFPGAVGVLTKVDGHHRVQVDVPFASGVAVDKQGDIYVSAYSLSPGTGAGVPGLDTSGQIWRVRL
jgi:hypothetical protein